MKVSNVQSSNLTATGTLTLYVTDVEENPQFDVGSPQGGYFVLTEYDVSLDIFFTKDAYWNYLRLPGRLCFKVLILLCIALVDIIILCDSL